MSKSSPLLHRPGMKSTFEILPAHLPPRESQSARKPAIILTALPAARSAASRFCGNCTPSMQREPNDVFKACLDTEIILPRRAFYAVIVPF